MPSYIAANKTRHRVTCPCGLYLDHHGPMEGRADAHAFLDRLMDQGRDHEQQIVASLPHFTVGDGALWDNAEATLRLPAPG